LREDDRFLFLQLLAAANDVFYLSYLGADPRDNSPREPSVLVSELLDAAARYHAEPKDSGQPNRRKQLVVHHTLQPFAPQAFGAAARGEQAPEPRRFSYRSEWHPGALATQGARAPIASFAAVALSAPRNSNATLVLPRDMELHALRRFLRDPPSAFLRERLGLRLPEADDRLPELEPFESPTGLRKHALRQAILAVWTETADALDETALQSILVARALLPSGPPGRMQLRALCDEMQPYVEAFTGWRGNQTATTQAIELAIGDWRLRGTLEGLYPNGAARLRLGELDGRTQIDHGLDWLVLSALCDPRPLVQIALHDSGIGSHARAPIPSQRALSALEWLLELHERGLREPLPFLPGSGWEAYADTDDDKGWSAAEKRWTGANGQSWAEGGTVSTRLALRARDPFTDDDPAAGKTFRKLSREIFDAVLSGDVPHDPASGDCA
jgi:exodeoxyribonuclease V gamma subunit